MRDEIKLTKQLGINRGGGVITAYAVTRHALIFGFVWKVRKHSYRGTEGWNKGLRCRDFNPVRWGYGKQVGEGPAFCLSRAQAVENLTERKY